MITTEYKRNIILSTKNTFRLKPKYLEQVKAEAEKICCSVGQWINQVVGRELKRLEAIEKGE